MKVLLVEDDSAIRLLVAGVLSDDHGHEVAAFATAEEAWDACQREHFPLAILDWMLPGMDGLELIRRLGKTERRPYLILVMTARTQPGDLVAALDAGADDYVPKPIDFELFDVRLTIAQRRTHEVSERVRAQRTAEESAKLAGVLLAARTAAHEINNALALPVGYADLLTLHPTVAADPGLLKQVTDIRDNVERAAEIINRLQRVIRLEEVPSPLGPEQPLLNIDLSIGE
jgi:DNA-binding response OmpR family regulator